MEYFKLDAGIYKNIVLLSISIIAYFFGYTIGFEKSRKQKEKPYVYNEAEVQIAIKYYNNMLNYLDRYVGLTGDMKKDWEALPKSVKDEVGRRLENNLIEMK